MKKYKVLFSSAALNDLKDAKAWYNSQQRGLGKRLIKDVKETTSAIALNPHYASIKFENIRTASCKIFPYSLHF